MADFGGINPLAGFAQGYQIGAAIQDRQLAVQQQRMAQMQQQQLNADILAVRNSANPTQGIADLALKYPQLSEQFKRSYDMMSQEQQQGQLSHATQVYAALQNGQNDLAVRMMRQRADAMKAAGSADQAQSANRFADLIEQQPDAAKFTGGLMLASALGPEKFATTFSTLGSESRAAAKAPAELAKAQADAVTAGADASIKTTEAGFAAPKAQMDLRNTQSQIDERAARLGLDRDKLTSEMQMKLMEFQQKAGELPDGVRKDVNDATLMSITSQQQASQLNDLATRLQAEGGGFGAAGTAAEWLKRAFGKQDAMTALRQEYTRLRSTQVQKLLPPGPATDRDVEIAMAGFPPPNADAKQLAGFLRGMAKLQTYDSVLSNARAEWIGANKVLGKATKDLEIDGVKVPAGATFKQFTDQYIPRKVGQLQGTSLVNDLARKYGGGASGAY